VSAGVARPTTPSGAGPLSRPGSRRLRYPTGTVRADFPFRPAALPFFYGWVVLGATTLGVLCSIPGQTMGVSVFTNPLLEATGLSRVAFSNAYLVGTVASGLALTAGGAWLDRFGVRRTVLAACLGLAATLGFLSAIDVAGARLAAALGGVAREPVTWTLLAVGFTALRFTGQGMLTLASRTTLARWFVRRRGLVSALSGAFVNFGFAAAPLGLHAWITAAGWRGAWQGMALVVGVGMGLVGWLLYRHDPEECGLRPDGDAGPAVDVGAGEAVKRAAGADAEDAGEAVKRAAGADAEDAREAVKRAGRAPDAGREPESTSPSGREISVDPTADPRDFTRAEALRTAAFWLVTLGVASHAMVGTGLTFHIVDLGLEAGLTEARAVAIFLPIALISVPTAFAAGAALDRWPVPRLMLAMMLSEIAMYAGMAYWADPAARALAIAGWGLSSGCFGPLTIAALPAYFGRRHLGAIQGAQMTALVLASAFGPALLAAGRDAFGSYRPGLLLLCVLPAAVAVGAPFVRGPERGLR